MAKIGVGSIELVQRGGHAWLMVENGPPRQVRSARVLDSRPGDRLWRLGEAYGMISESEDAPTGAEVHHMDPGHVFVFADLIEGEPRVIGFPMDRAAAKDFWPRLGIQ